MHSTIGAGKRLQAQRVAACFDHLTARRDDVLLVWDIQGHQPSLQIRNRGEQRGEDAGAQRDWLSGLRQHAGFSGPSTQTSTIIWTSSVHNHILGKVSWFRAQTYLLLTNSFTGMRGLLWRLFWSAPASSSIAWLLSLLLLCLFFPSLFCHRTSIPFFLFPTTFTANEHTFTADLSGELFVPDSTP